MGGLWEPKKWGTGMLSPHYNRLMRIVFRFWSLWITLALVPLLILLALFQFRWIGEMGERERYRLVQGLYTTANRLSTALQDEVAVLPLVFGVGADEVSDSFKNNDWTDFKHRWDIWKAYSMESSIVEGLYLFKRPQTQGVPSTLWQWDGQAFIPKKDSTFSELLTTIINTYPMEFGFFDGGKSPAEGELFLVPLPLGQGRDYFWLGIKLNREAFAQKLLPVLAGQLLFGKSDYYFRVVDRKRGTTLYTSSSAIDERWFNHPDFQYPLLKTELSQEPYKTETAPLKGTSTEPIITLLRSRRDSLMAQGDPDRRIESYLTPYSVRNRDRLEGALWVLEAVHRSGSLTAVVRLTTIRNMIISSAILLLLALVLVILAVAVRRTQELSERQGEFIASVTHELKTPIAVIYSAANNLASGIIKGSERTVQYGRTIEGESKRLTKLIDRLLLYARLGDTQRPSFESLNLGDLVTEVVESYRKDLEAANFAVEVSIKQDIWILGDKSALEMALGNLVSNGLKHAAQGKYLALRLDTELRRHRSWNKTFWAVLTVQDHGKPVPRRERRLIFEPFYRGEEARKSQRRGSGLGLNVVRRIVQIHGGTVQYRAQGESGSLFILTFPWDTSRVE